MLVVAALLRYGDAYAFMIREHRPFEHRPNLVGGRIEEGEEAEHAIIRENREETGCEAQVKRIGTIDIAYHGREPTPHTFYRAWTNDQPHTTEPDEGTIVLLSIDEALNHSQLHPFTKQVIELIIAGEPFSGSARIGPGPEYQVLEFTLGNE